MSPGQYLGRSTIDDGLALQAVRLLGTLDHSPGHEVWQPGRDRARRILCTFGKSFQRDADSLEIFSPYWFDESASKFEDSSLTSIF